MKYSGEHMGNILKLTVITLIMLCMALPIMADAQSVKLNVKDSGGTQKFVVTDTGFVGIGNNNPQSPIHVVGTTLQTTSVRSYYINPTPQNLGNENGGGGFIAYFNYPNNGLPLLGDKLGYYLFGAVDTDGVTSRNGAGIVAKAENNWVSGLNGSTASMPSYLTLETTGVSGERLERVRVTGSGNVGIGLPDPLNYKLYVAGSIHVTSLYMGSDKKLKKNITDIDTPLEKVMRLKGHKYEFNRDEFVDRNLPEGTHYGVIAQEVEKVLPEMVRDNEDGTKSVDYTSMIPVLIEAIKTQQKQIDELKARIR